MVFELTREQQLVLDRNGNSLPEAHDPSTNVTYVLLPKSHFELLLARAQASEFDPRAMYPMMAHVAHEAGWDDPEMDVYNQMDPRRKP